MINAVILLNDDLDNVNDCNTYNSCQNSHIHKGSSNLFFLLSVSIPRPMFPIAGYPIIYHHIRSLSEIEQVQHVFLIGKYDPKKFSHFIDDLLSEFSFKTIQFIQDEVPKNEGGVIFKYKNKILLDNPEYLFIMRYKICSSFPLTDIIKFHKQKEREMDQLQDSLRETQPLNSLITQNLALVTVLGARVETEKNKNYGCFAVDEHTQEMLHYAENTDVHISNLINYGIYMFSVRIFTEYGLTPYPDDQSPNNDNVSSHFNFQSEGCATPQEQQHSTASGSDFLKMAAVQQQPSENPTRIQAFQHAFTYLNSIEESITIKDLLMPMCNKKKAFIYEIDWQKDFVKEIARHEDKLTCQNIYFQHYNKLCPELLLQPDDLIEGQVLGHCFIHPTADIHHTAVLGPNVSIGAYAKIHEGCRIVNSIILEDAEVQAHTVVINSMVGWNCKIGPWCRIEGTLFSDERSKFLHGQKFDVCVLGVGTVVQPEVMLRNCLVMPFIKVKENNANKIIF